MGTVGTIMPQSSRVCRKYLFQGGVANMSDVEMLVKCYLGSFELSKNV